MLTIRLLGEMAISRDGSVQPLPPSKKTRALLAYLALTGRPHRRERLCSLFWEIPHDPRGALRWSLSRLRPLVDDPDLPCIAADRDVVGFVDRDTEIDVVAFRRALAGGVEVLDTGTLEALAARFPGELLEGQDLPDLHDFQAWCVAEREDARRLHAQLLAALVERHAERPEAALPHARRLVQIDPYALKARISQLSLLLAAGRRGEAEQHFETGLRLLREADGDTGALSAAWRRLQAGPGRQSAPEPAAVFDQTQGAAQPSPAPAPLVLPREAPEPALVGRMPERRALLDALAQAAAGKARVVLVAGEPGLGKSALLDTFLEAASGTGGAVLMGMPPRPSGISPSPPGRRLWLGWTAAFPTMPPVPVLMTPASMAAMAARSAGPPTAIAAGRSCMPR